MALPTFFIIGAPKAGTTSLNYYLNQHPQIQMSTVKEPAFFAPSPDPLDERRSINRLDQYERLFEPAVGVRGEASTNYAEYPFRQGVPERIKELVPHAKFLYLVRDPVDRTVSHYHHLVADSGERRSPQELFNDLSDPRTPSICASLYGLQLELYLRHFAQDRILVIDQAELLADRRSTLCNVFVFLEVDDTFNSSRFDVELLRRSEHRLYPPGLARFVGRTVRPRSWWLPPRARRVLRRSAERILLPPLEEAVLDGELRTRLEALYAGEVERLRALTGKMFPTWSI